MESKWMLCKAAVAAAGGWILYGLGGLDNALISLLVLMVLDYFTGLLKAWCAGKLSSATGFKGIAKKVMGLSVVALAFIIQKLTGGAFALREVVILFFIANESLSILENAAQAGLPIPQKLRDALEQLKSR